MKKSISAYIYLVALAILFTACGSTPVATTSSSVLDKAVKQSALTPTASATAQSCQQGQMITPTSTPSAQAQAQGSVDKSLATGYVDALPQGNLIASILSASQTAGASMTHKHGAGFVYVVNGSQTLAEQGGPTKTLNAGDGAFVKDNTTYTHTNAGKSTNDWNFIALRQVTTETPAASLPNQKTVYQTPTLPTSVFSKGAYCESLLRTEQQPNGRSASQRYSGIEVLNVLDGSLKVDVAGQDPKTLTAGQSTYVLPHTPMQVSNTGSSVARFLSFVAWPSGQPLSEHLSALPAEVGTPAPTSTVTATGTATETPTGTATEMATPVR